MPPDKGLASSHHHGFKMNKTLMMIALTCNATGQEHLPILFIGMYECPQCFNKNYGFQLGYQYCFNSKAWMDRKIFQKGLIRWNNELREKQHKVLFLLDNFKGHEIPPEGVSNINVVFFLPNLTPYVQPLDAGIIRTSKAGYCR
ncbi:hypothetical protein O181_102490 [Austropuccinia psidii MF-1]|uniref:DDE-1 domain-containing protein n=1 Tax=Austropuccinia psidii MF-1 TaxID=1389203 RepID=A0A9Q3PIT4_9BASI|nr:hypothetical protein [Austropuccinia psidii MF-1]